MKQKTKTFKVLPEDKEFLTQKSKYIIEDSKALRKIIREMKFIRSSYVLGGLAATQVGYPMRLAVIMDIYDKYAIDDIVLINPKVIQTSGRTVSMVEECMSVPGKEIVVPRPDRIKVLNYTLEGKMYYVVFTGYLARIVLHEIDHMEGKLITEWDEKSVLESSFPTLYYTKESRPDPIKEFKRWAEVNKKELKKSDIVEK